MSISLQKGQKVSLTKENAGLSNILIGLGWDEAKRARGGFFAPKPQPIDCDASALLLKGGKLYDKSDIIYFGNLQHKTGAVWHMGDNLTGAGDGDDEQIVVDLSRLPQEYDRIVLVVNIYQALQRTNREMCKYNLTENYSGMTAMIFGEVYRHNGEWKFNAIGQGTNDPGIGQLAQRYL